MNRDETKKKVCAALQEITHELPLSWWDHIPGGPKIKEYFNLTTLHGLKYFAEPGRSLSERYFWIAALTLVYVGAVIAVYDQIVYFLHTPVLISIDDKPTPVWDIPFPAITICSENQVRPSYFNQSAFDGKPNMTQEEQEIFEYISLSCNENTTTSKLEFFSPDILNKVHKEVWRHCNETYMMTWMSDDLKDPCETFQPSLMSAGACHTFNALPGNLLYRPSVYNFLQENKHGIKYSNENIWSPDKGYSSSNQFDSPPWRMPGGGFGQDLQLILNLNVKDFNDQCFYGGHGFFVTFHSPAELPTLAHPATYIHADHLAMIKIRPDIKVTDKILKRWAPSERGCFFEDERPLKYFNLYTEKNCDLECETNVSLAKCGCVPFYLPFTKEIPICGPTKEQCFLDSISKSLDPLATGCNCMPACFEVEYNIDVVNFRRNWSIAGSKGFKYDNFETLHENNFAVFKVQYQTQKVIAMKRIAVFGLSDFIANIGGLLGLFLGFSFLSLFEIFYFFALRFRHLNPNNTKVVPAESKPPH